MQTRDGLVCKTLDCVWKCVKVTACSAPLRVTLFVVVLSALVFMSSWTKLFNIIDIDDYIARKVRPIVGRHMDNPFNYRVAVILASNDDNGGLGVPAPNAIWRGYYAEMVTALNKAGAREVVFDLNLPDQTSSDGRLAEAIRGAVNNPDRGKRTEVIVGIHVQNGKVVRDVADTLKPALQGRLANTQVGGKYNGYIRVYQLAYFLEDQPTDAPEIPVGASLALQAIIDDQNEASRITPYFNRNDSQINLRLNGPDGPITQQIPVIEKEYTFDLMFDMAEEDDLKQATHKFNVVYNSLKNNQYANLHGFEGKIVLIGHEGSDVHRVVGEQSPYGINIQASIISSIMNHIYIRPLPTLYNIIVIAAMIAVGVSLQTCLRGFLRFKVPIPLPRVDKKIEPPVSLVCVILIYLLLSFIYYERTLQIFDISYHLVGLWLSFAIVSLARLRGILGLKTIPLGRSDDAASTAQDNG